MLQPAFAELENLFAWVNPAYREIRFLPTVELKRAKRNKRSVTFYYFRMKRLATTAEIIAAIEAAGFRPVLYEEFLAFVGAHPNEQNKFPIAALGSFAWLEGKVCYAFADALGKARGLNLVRDFDGRKWLSDFVFLVAEK